MRDTPRRSALLRCAPPLHNAAGTPTRLPDRWGATEAEHATPYAADRLAATWTVRRRLTRAVDVDAPAPLVYRWLCQLAVAPYSYDWIDHRGRRSPRELTPGADDLRRGQRMLGVFTLVEVVPGESLTLTATPRRSRVVGRVALTYAVTETATGDVRLLGRLVMDTPTRLHRLGAWALAWGDLVMMRRQLRTLRAYAERDASR